MTLRKQIHKPRREVISGVYKLTHKPSGKFYIGSSTDIRQRFHIHKSLFKHNKNHNKLQETYNTTNQIVDWKLQVIEICHASKLNKTEQMYIKMYIIHRFYQKVKRKATEVAFFYTLTTVHLCVNGLPSALCFKIFANSFLRSSASFSASWSKQALYTF